MTKNELSKIRITTYHGILTFNGTAAEAIDLLDDIEDQRYELPKVISDFLFIIEMQLQREDVYDCDFNLKKAS
jgi:hypothetical protein